jgi:hypothetical protein
VAAVAGGASWTREAAGGMRLARACSCVALQPRWLAEAMSTAAAVPTFRGGQGRRCAMREGGHTARDDIIGERGDGADCHS